MPLSAFLPQLRSLKATITRKALVVLIQLPPRAVDQNALTLLNNLLDACESRYFLILIGLPPCLMPGARDHILQAKAPDARFCRIPACKSCSLTASCPGWDKRLACAPEDARPIKDIPSEIVLEITQNCNLSCRCCTTESKCDLLAPVDAVKAVLDEATDLGIKNIRFTGGEPLLHPHLQDLLAYSRAKRFYTLLNTNATLLTPFSIRSLSRTVDNVLVSLQGFNETSDQKLTRSPLPFKRKINNILLLRKNIPTVRVGTVITRVLIENLPSYAKLVKALGVDSWELFRPLTGSPDNLARISRVEYRQLALQALRLKASGINIKLANAIPFCLLPDPHTSASIMLGAASDDGHSRLVWDPRGYFKPSYFIPRDLGHHIQDAWDSHFLQELRSLSSLPQECRHCDFLTWCKGGSRSAAHQTYGTYFTSDPLFQHRPKKNLRLTSNSLS